MFLFLAVHGAKQLVFARIGVRSRRVLRSNPEFDWTQLFNRSEALGAGRTCRLGIYPAAESLETEVPASVASLVRADRQMGYLAEDVRRRIQEPQDVDAISGQIFNLILKNVSAIRFATSSCKARAIQGKKSAFCNFLQCCRFLHFCPAYLASPAIRVLCVEAHGALRKRTTQR
jgi:hypothetical protein